ncbi:hypothetical protein OUZ56_024744 [Daphnia magna]|uniref:Uncharacterized protein n=1 Tax=Daphnia magna TaxID=35525 RepID=A0ABQ9ZIW5_9CRUS|nr:hypothetical protein OUZ56_024744 [Daphnia magna]
MPHECQFLYFVNIACLRCTSEKFSVNCQIILCFYLRRLVRRLARRLVRRLARLARRLVRRLARRLVPCPSSCPSSVALPVASSTALPVVSFVALPVESSTALPVVFSAAQPSLRPSPSLRLVTRAVFTSPVAAPSSPRGRPVTASLLGSGSAVLPNGLYAMGGTVAQAVWLKVDRRGNAPVGTSPLSMWWWLPGKLGGIEPLTSGTLVKCFAAEPTITY